MQINKSYLSSCLKQKMQTKYQKNVISQNGMYTLAFICNRIVTCIYLW